MDSVWSEREASGQITQGIDLAHQADLNRRAYYYLIIMKCGIIKINDILEEVRQAVIEHDIVGSPRTAVRY